MASEIAKTDAKYSNKERLEKAAKDLGHEQIHKELQEKLAKIQAEQQTQQEKKQEPEAPQTENKQGKLAGLYSSKNHDWLSPPDLVQPLVEAFKLELDAATTHDNPLGFKYILTPEQDALKVDWQFNAWLNPPFKWAREFTAHAMRQSALHKTTIVEILANRTETATYQTYGKHAQAFVLINKRIAYIDASTNQQMQQPNFGSILLIFKPDPLTQEQLALLQSMGLVLGHYKA